MLKHNQIRIRYLPLCLLLSFAACTSQESRNLKVYTDGELASRSERGTFLETYQALRDTPFSDETSTKIIALTQAMKEAQSRRLKALEKLDIQDKRLRNIHGSLLQAERTILNAIVAFEGLMEGDKIDPRQYRVNLSILEETVNKGEPLFTTYESALTQYQNEVMEN